MAVLPDIKQGGERDVFMKGGFLLYRKPLIAAGVMAGIGFAMIICTAFAVSASGSMNYYAFYVFGFMLIVAGAVTAIIYGLYEKKFRDTLKKPLLWFRYSPQAGAQAARKNIEEIKSANKAALMLILFFCALMFVGGLFFGEDGRLFSLIALGIAVFMSLAYLIITTYRVRKLASGSLLMVLSAEGAYVAGEFHCWNTPASRLNRISLDYTQTPEPGYQISISYLAATYPGPSEYHVVVPVPAQYFEAAKSAVTTIEQSMRPFSN